MSTKSTKRITNDGNDRNRLLKHPVILDYTLSFGGFSPYLEQLRQGVALASFCLSCRRVAYPPDRHCSCALDGRNPDPKLTQQKLSGLGTIRFRTDGLRDSFALIHFDGTDNLATARLTPPEAQGLRVRLSPSGGKLPGLLVEILEDPKD